MPGPTGVDTMFLGLLSHVFVVADVGLHAIYSKRLRGGGSAAIVALVSCPEIGPEFARQEVKPHSPVTGFVDLIFCPNFGPPSEPENRVISSARFFGKCESLCCHVRPDPGPGRARPGPVLVSRRLGTDRGEAARRQNPHQGTPKASLRGYFVAPISRPEFGHEKGPT